MDTFPQKFALIFARINPSLVRWLVMAAVLVMPIICDPGLPGDIGLH